MQGINKWEKPFHIERGDVYVARLPESQGSEQGGYCRPVVVTQCNRQNKTSTTVVVAAGTSQRKRLDLPYHVLVSKRKGLSKDTVFCGEQRFTLSVDRFIRYCCTLDKVIMEKITRACRRAAEADENHRKW